MDLVITDHLRGDAGLMGCLTDVHALQEWREREQDQEETWYLLQLRMIFSAISFGFCGGTHSFE